MEERYTIRVDAGSGVVEAEIIGFWTVATVAEFGVRLRQAFDQIERAGKIPVLLSDSTHAAVQSPDVVAAMTRLGHDLAPLPRKTAMLTSGQLLQFQAKRVVDAGTSFRAFTDYAQAIAWLKESDTA